MPDAWTFVQRFPDKCVAEVSRKGMSEPCDKPGIAIVPLAEPDHATANTAAWNVLDHDRVRRNVTKVLWEGRAFDADEARSVAAALLAAAGVAEEQTNA